MKKILLALGAIALLSANIEATYIINSMGNFDFISGSDGSSFIGMRLGGFYFIN